MIRAVIIEDEDFIQEEIQTLLEDLFSKEINIVNQSGSVQEGTEAIETYHPELVFLDIQLPDGNAFELLEKINFKEFNLIFVTGYDTRAIEAIKVGALDYLLKPIDALEFENAVQKVLSIEEQKNRDTAAATTVAYNHFHGKQNKRIVLKTLDTFHVIDLDDILYCQSDGNYTTIFLKDEKILLSKHIKKIAELLPQKLFVRCHQSYLVNKVHVKKFHKRGVLILLNGIEVPVSGRRRDFTLKNIFS